MDLVGLRKIWERDRESRERARSKRQMFEHNWRDSIKDEILVQFLPQNAEKLCARVDTSVNLLRWATDELAAIYSRPVQRSIGELPMDVSAEVDMSLDLACKLTFVQVESLLRPMWLGDRMGVDVIPRDRFNAIPDPLDRMRLNVVFIEHSRPDGSTSKIELWTRDTAVLLDASWRPIPTDRLTPDGQVDTSNPYGQIPFVVAHSEYPTSSFWSGATSDGLVEASLALGVAMTDHMHLRHLQSFKQLVIRTEGKNRSAIAKLASDPSSVLLLSGPTASASVLDMQADLRAHLDSLLTKAETTLQLYGIRPEVVRGTQDAQSGYALQLKLHKQESAWERMRQLWRLWEDRLWDSARVTLPVEGGPTLPDGPVHLEFQELGPGRDPQQIADQTRADVAAGVISKREALRLRGYSAEQIDRILVEIMDDQVTSVALSPPPPMAGAPLALEMGSSDLEGMV